jgi:hypothetical protein
MHEARGLVDSHLPQRSGSLLPAIGIPLLVVLQQR